MQGGTGSGKSFTLEGGFPAAGGPRQIGLVERLIIQLSTQSTAVTTPSGPACAIRLHLAELTKSEEVVRIHREENFASAAAAIARYRQAARQFNKLQRPDTTATQGRGSDHVAAASMSSRSWTHLILVSFPSPHPVPTTDTAPCPRRPLLTASFTYMVSRLLLYLFAVR